MRSIGALRFGFCADLLALLLTSELPTRGDHASTRTIFHSLNAFLAASLDDGTTCYNPALSESGVAVLLIDTDRVTGTVDKDIYGHFLEHINHSVVDGLYAEQVRGQGFEANDFATYWEVRSGEVTVVDSSFKSGSKSLRLEPSQNTATVHQGRFYLQEGESYGGSVWLKPVGEGATVTLRVLDVAEAVLAEAPLTATGSQ